MAASQETSRLYHCARCHSQVVICRRCDRGQRYCSVTCSKRARRDSVRRASRRYQKSDLGARNHARRQQRYRVRRARVTHQGSAATETRAKIPLMEKRSKPAPSARAPRNAIRKSITAVIETIESALIALRCHFCQHVISGFLRVGFIQSPSEFP